MHTTSSIKKLLAVGALAAGLGAGPAAADVEVAATIKPVHSLVAAVMDGIGEPALLLDGPASPHVTALRPSQARIVENADIVFAVGEGLEAFLHGLMEAGGARRIVELADAPGIRHLDYRDAGGHDDHGSDEHHDEHDEHDDHDSEGHDAENHGAHEHGDTDPHIWLDPANARAMIVHIATVLGAADPANAEAYADNAQDASRELDDLESELAARLVPVKDRPFLVFHDAYHYFEDSFGLKGLGAIVLNPETPPGARRLSEIRHRIAEADVGCVFSEPQFEIGYVTTVLEDTDARTASLDPLGVTVEPGAGAYRQILSDLTDSLADCLAGD